ncbi:CPBP family intramembrane glutamic endopeptidase [Rhodanobacter sp. L36]|uniref:CPBP family intramembrane glutamic endopeptidase n=1 Tax=Rhodanobacter sp. L36 TaxID=1747221 RepID=UPI00131C303A|nr:CPBP family intramembrane glutamic endopeptidase [Rhodanobacter sp. L36]
MSTVAAQAVQHRKKLWLIILGGLMLSLGVISLPFGRWDDSLASVGHMAGNELVYWGLVAAVLFYVLRVERRPLSSIGLKTPGIVDLLLACATGALIVAMLAVIYLVVFPALHWDETNQLQTLTAVPFWLRLMQVIRAAVSEEILFRGYALERIEQLSGSRLFSGVSTWAIFTLEHLSYWGWHHLLIAGLAGALLTLLYLWRRNLWANMLAHFIVDGVGFLLG